MIKLVNVSKYYTTNNVVALGLRKANLELGINEFVAVVGESGSGKTTLLNVISGIDTYEEGEMYVNGEETSYYSTADLENYRKKYIAFVFQNYNLVDSFTVLQNVELPLLLSGFTKKAAKTRAMEIIRQVGLEKHVHHKATKLSGGQKQRVVIARALAKDCPIIAADEPTGNLDSESAKQIIKLLHDISKDKLVIVVTHDFDQVREYATRKIRIYDGEIVEDATVQKVSVEEIPAIADEEKKIRFFEHIKLAFRNLIATPKKTILMVLVFFIFSFFVGTVYGAFNLVMSGDDGGTWYTSIDTFGNKSISRIVLNKTDYSAFTDADLAELEGYSQVQTLIAKDYLLDIAIEMRSKYRLDALDDFFYLGSVRYLPLSVVQDAGILTEGAMPSAPGEALLALPASTINEHKDENIFVNTLYYQSGVRDIGIYTADNYLITGIVDCANIFMDEKFNYLIVSDEEFANIANLYYPYFVKERTLEVEFGDGTKMENKDMLTQMLLYSNVTLAADNTLADNQLSIPQEFEYYFCEYGSDTCDTLTGVMTFEDAYTRNTFPGLELQFSTNPVIGVSPAVYQGIMYDDIYQLSVITDSDINIERLVNNLSRIKSGDVEKYNVIYPYNFATEDPYGSAITFFQGLGMLVALLVTIIATTFLSYIIFRAIINTKLRDYAIFRTVGANQMVIRLIVYMENLFVIAFSFVLFVGLTLGLRLSDVITQYSLFYGLNTFAFTDYLIFFGILIVMSLLISGRYCGRVFRDTVQTSLKAE